jgi:hypothetical protein
MLGLLGATGVGMGLNPSVGACQEHSHGSAPTGSRPVDAFQLHFCGIHVAKNNSKFQLTTQHYCGHRGNVHQCLLFDSSAPDAKLLGVEYIIPNEIYQALSADEKKYWHPHTYEVLAGGLIAPTMTDEEELAFMKALLTTWGKTWHTWPDPTTDIPYGDPLLMWALTADGQIDEQVLAQRDREFGVDSVKIRATRCQSIGYDVPSVSFPRSMDQVGRQWTDNGQDRPRAIK